MSKFQNPYIVTYDHAFDAKMFEGDWDKTYTREYLHIDPTQKWEPWNSFKLVIAILKDMANLEETHRQHPLAHFNTRMENMQNRIKAFAPDLFLLCYSIEKPHDANQWPQIVWNYVCHPNGLVMRNESHKIIFFWKIVQINGQDRYTIKLRYDGPFTLVEVPANVPLVTP